MTYIADHDVALQIAFTVKSIMYRGFLLIMFHPLPVPVFLAQGDVHH